ncbi:non-ribosomal peptide synthetase [Pedobacter cryoconitis]|uniref:Amino acid adenylation domain-containing protein n=1 Tax=Pedobacter cryoconitis TaxID=188932 RepID=A0A7X0IZM4_9SPHI|nr:non-ribosomal peptide synthetase [Pedobacter cryoconitis]MBB6498128.1 amino acid adenylation domain-containing protein [Pedobacter cryoconitis]
MIDPKQNLIYKKVDFNPFSGGEITHTAPSTEPQTELWTSCMLGGNDANRAYNESISLRLKGEVDPELLKETISRLVERHEALRSAFSGDGSKMLIFDRIVNDLSYLDISAWSAEDQLAELRKKVQDDALFVFDLLNGPLFKTSLLKLSDREYHFTFTAHHIICDGWSLGIILQDISKIYSALAKRMTPILPQVSSLTDFAYSELAFSKSTEHQKNEAFWLNQYQHKIPVLDVPVDHRRPQTRTFKSKRLDFKIDRTLIHQLKDVGKTEGCGLVITILSAFEVFLYLLTGQKDIVVGLPASGQSVTGHYNLVGHCVNLLPLRSYPNKNFGFKEYLSQRKPAILDAFDHQQMTWGNLLRNLKISRDPSRIPLVPVVFNVDMGMDDGVSFENLDYQLLNNPRAFESFELFINAGGSADDFVLEWSFNTALFEDGTVKQMMNGFEKILRFVVAHPEQKLKNLLLENSPYFLSDPVFKRSTAVLKTLTNDYSHEIADLKKLTIQGLFEDAASKFKDQTAITFQDESISYSNLDIRADNLSRAILHRAPDQEIIGLSTTRGINMIVGILAILKAGKAYLPLDPTYPEARLSQIIEESEIQFCLAGSVESKFFKKLNLKTIDYDLTYSLPVQEINFRNPNGYVLFTSGSTGKPKGVYVPQLAFVNLAQWQMSNSIATVGSKTLQFAPLTFDVSFQEIFSTLCSGGHLILIDDVLRLNPDNLLDKIEREQISRVYLPFVALQFLAETATSMEKFPKSLKEVMTAGEQLKITPQIEQFFTAIPNCILYNQYGPTECHVIVTQLKLSGKPANWPMLPTIGTPIANTSAYIVDESLDILPQGKTGELCIAGACLAEGYLNQPELTEERFVMLDLPNGKQVRAYRTGDLANILSDGNIEFLGRNDEQVKIRGHRIEIGEVEAVLSHIPGIAQVVVTAKEDHNGQKRLVAYLASSTGKQDTPFVRNEIQNKLPGYMIPSVFVWLMEFPRNSSGKIDKKLLPAPDHLHAGDLSKYTAPQTETEITIVRLWEELLNVKEIGIDDNFFELGGHSLIAIQFMIQIEKANGHGLPLATLFEYPTVRTLGKLLDGQSKLTNYTSLVPIKPSGTKTPIYIVHGAGYNVLNFSGIGLLLDDDQPVFGIQAQGLDGVEVPMDNMEDIARNYVESILEQNPSGPYALAGYSFGGYVVIEMARQLREMGHEIKMLGIFDTNARNLDLHGSTRDIFLKRLKMQIPKLKWIVRSLINRPLPTLIYQKNIFKYKLMELFGISHQEKEEEQSGIYEIMRRIDEKYDIAYMNYKLTPFDEKIHLFRATDNIYFVEDYKYLGWQKYAMKGVEVHDVSGDHKTMLLAPHDKGFAKTLQQVLDKES